MGEGSERTMGAAQTPTVDPWKGLRGVMAATLVLEGIVVLLALPVVGVVGRGLTWWSVGYVVGLALLMFAGAGLQRRPWALTYNLVLQIAFLAGAFVHVSIGIIGLVFALIWVYILYLRRDVARRMERGELPAQRAG